MAPRTKKPKDCPRCGVAHARCTAHARSGAPCGLWPLRGQKVCRMHGGSTPVAKEAAQRRKALAEAQAAVVTFGLPREIDPGSALLEEIHRTAGHVAWLQIRVREIDPDALVWGTTRVKTGGDDRGTTEEAKPNVWLVEYRTERKHLLEVCKAALGLGLDERRVHLAEEQGMVLGQVLQAIFGDPRLALTKVQFSALSTVVPEHVRTIGGTQ